jgi:hypothetical protein
MTPVSRRDIPVLKLIVVSEFCERPILVFANVQQGRDRTTITFPIANVANISGWWGYEEGPEIARCWLGSEDDMDIVTEDITEVPKFLREDIPSAEYPFGLEPKACRNQRCPKIRGTTTYLLLAISIEGS